MLSSLLTIPLLMLLLAMPLVVQAKQFLHVHDGEALTLLQVSGVMASFVLAGSSLLLFGLHSGVSPLSVGKCLTLLAWGIPMVLLDLRQCWLPLRFTSGFWVTGVLFTLLPGNTLSWWEALLGSGGMFLFLYAFYVGARWLRQGEDGFGLGDVHLIAALCAWLPWPLASLLSGCGFLLFIIGAVLTQKRTQPYAPWLFALLAGLAVCFPQLTLFGAL